MKGCVAAVVMVLSLGVCRSSQEAQQAKAGVDRSEGYRCEKSHSDGFEDTDKKMYHSGTKGARALRSGRDVA
ncbi:hypothetical protein ACRTDR_00140 [Shewanella algae]